MLSLRRFVQAMRRRETRYAWLEPYYRKTIASVVRGIFRPRYYGFEKLPREGAALIICNHVSYLDGLIIAAGLHDRPIRFVIDKYIYEQPVIHHVMSVNRAIPIAPKKAVVEQALQAIADGLAAGDLVCIFPEGQITYTGNLGRFRPGVEWILKRQPVPVYPLALAGLWGSIYSRKYLRARFRFVPRFPLRKIRIICGDPLAPEEVSVTSLQRAVMLLKNRVKARP
jgi:1-acyl-sn-glycerol-3-phosphate acyltransferase